jgi:hypothetical protein
MIAWCPCTDSNRDRAPFESAASTDWATRTLSRHCLCNGIATFGAPRRIRTATARILSPSPLPVGLVERNGATGADRTRGLVLTRNALFRLSYGGDGAREGGRLPGLRVTRAALYAELRGHDWGRRRGSNSRPWLYKNPAFPLCYAGKKNSQTAGTNPAKNVRCLKPPFAAPPKGTSTGSAGHLMSLQGRPS